MSIHYISSNFLDLQKIREINWDVNNGIARRSWVRNDGALFAIKRAMETEPQLKVTIPNRVDESLF